MTNKLEGKDILIVIPFYEPDLISFYEIVRDLDYNNYNSWEELMSSDDVGEYLVLLEGMDYEMKVYKPNSVTICMFE